MDPLDRDDDLERLVRRALARLPEPHAPRSLLPRVLAAVAESAPRPWYSRAWLTWPALWQGASLAVFVAALGLAGTAWMVLAGGWDIGVESTFVGPAASRVAVVAQTLEALARSMRILWRVLLQPAVADVFVLAVILTLAGGALWSAVTRVTFEGVSHR